MDINRLDCNSIGVEELNNAELEDIQGGLFWIVLGAILGVAAAVCALIDAFQKD